jgi:hypothetical protein
MKRNIRFLDVSLVLFLVVFFSLTIISQGRITKKSSLRSTVSVEIVVPNLEPEVAGSINLSDLIVDQNGKAVFEITEKIEKASEHPVIDQKGNLVIAKHPRLKSLFLMVKSTKRISYSNGIKYNWQVVKIGGSLVWETKYTRFVGLVRRINS